VLTLLMLQLHIIRIMLYAVAGGYKGHIVGMPITKYTEKQHNNGILLLLYYASMRQLMRLCYKNDTRIINGIWILDIYIYHINVLCIYYKHISTMRIQNVLPK